MKFYNILINFNTLILGNIYIPFYGYIKINIAEYFLISIIGSLWLLIIFILTIRFIKDFYNKFDSINSRLRKKLLFIFSFIFYLFTTSYVTLIYPPTGDEPHYITIATSIIKDFDLNLLNNYEDNKYYSKFYPAYINDYKDLHTIKINNHYYSTHNIGLPILISPLIITNGRYWLQFFLNFITALLILMIYILLNQMNITEKNAAGISLLTGICMPIITHSSLILTEIPAALLISFSIYFLMLDKTNFIKNIIFFSSIAALPWLHSKYLIFSITLYIVYYFKILKNKTFILKKELINNIPVIISIFLNIFYYFSIFNIFFPFEINKIFEKKYLNDFNLQVNRFEISLSQFFVSFLAIFFDRDFGLITYCILYIISLWGMILAFIRKNKKFLMPLAICIPYLILFLFWKDWTGSMAPARQLVPIIPLFILFAAYFINSINIIKTKLFIVLFTISIFFSWLSTSFPLLRYAMSKDKIYLFFSNKIPSWTLLILPSFRENILLASITSFIFIIIIFYIFFYIYKRSKIIQ